MAFRFCIHARDFCFVARLHLNLRLRRSVVPGAKQLIEGRGTVSVVHFKMFVVQVMGKCVGINGAIVSHFYFVEANMTNHSTCSSDLQIVEEQQGVRRHDEVNE